MTKKEVLFCDFCKDEIDEDEQFWKIIAQDPTDKNKEQDCCYDCYHGKLSSK